MNKIVFLSNYLNHHQIDFCDALYKKLKSNFLFYSTESINRLEEGAQLNNIHRPYLRYLHDSRLHSDLNDSKVIIFASGPKNILISLVNSNKIVFFYSERLFKKSFLQALHPRNIMEYFCFYKKIDKNNVYFLAAGSYVKGDLKIYNLFNNRILRWGYFPSFKKYHLDKLVQLKRNNKVKILWVGRMINWKRPLILIDVANFLKYSGIKNFSITVIGKGILINSLKEKIKKFNLQQNINIIESVKPSKIHRFFSRSHIFISTSNKQEGWGATINEALSYGCHTFASYNIGASKFLINNEYYEYKNLNHLKKNILNLIISKNYMKINKKGFNTINFTWNGSKAASRFITFSNSLINQKSKEYSYGPLSKV
jgi:glycosyltransferase involved in cell wall biosynthesis